MSSENLVQQSSSGPQLPPDLEYSVKQLLFPHTLRLEEHMETSSNRVSIWKLEMCASGTYGVLTLITKDPLQSESLEQSPSPAPHNRLPNLLWMFSSNPSYNNTYNTHNNRETIILSVKKRLFWPISYIIFSQSTAKNAVTKINRHWRSIVYFAYQPPLRIFKRQKAASENQLEISNTLRRDNNHLLLHSQDRLFCAHPLQCRLLPSSHHFFGSTIHVNVDWHLILVLMDTSCSSESWR